MADASGGKVNVRLYAGGVAGDDPDVVRKMRLGTLNAGVLTSVGVAEIDKSVYALGVPMMYASYEEVYYVLEKMRPRLEANLEAKGFVVLNWADGGWVHFFAQQPVADAGRPQEAEALLLGGRQPSRVEIWKSAGFNPVPLPSTEIATGAADGPGDGARRAAAGRGDRAVLQPREEHDGPALAAPAGGHGRHARRPGRRSPPTCGRRCSRPRGRRARGCGRRSARARSSDIEAMKKRGLNVVAGGRRQRASCGSKTRGEHVSEASAARSCPPTRSTRR